LEGEIMAIVTVGIDLAKNVFAVHGVDETGKPALVRPEVPRTKLVEHIANLPPCLIGMEACSGAHHWAREFAKFAICEAVTRPNMRFVPVNDQLGARCSFRDDKSYECSADD
jgi:transposase